MNKRQQIQHQFVRTIPDEVEEGTLYVSIEYGTVVHKCCCGCGQEVVTPLSPTDWKLIFNGETVSLYPSIGNWSFACRSHYWIRDGTVQWARDWSAEEIESGRLADRRSKQDFYQAKERGDSPKATGWSRFVGWLEPRHRDDDDGD